MARADLFELFLSDQLQSNPDQLGDVYVLTNFRPVVTNKNWRMDCSVAGYDNTFGLPPFFLTRLRFEDYIYRLWVQQKGLAAAHVDAAQNHLKSSYMRNPLASEVFNEEVSNLLKRKIKASVSGASCALPGPHSHHDRGATYPPLASGRCSRGSPLGPPRRSGERQCSAP